MKGATFPCGALVPLNSTQGSLELESRNWTGGEIHETFRIFAAGKTSVSRTVSLDLPALPTIICVDAEGKRYLLPDDQPKNYPILISGHSALISGVAFLPKQILWIGKTRIPVESTDSENISLKVPDSLPAGVYPMSLTNERGRGNTVNVRIID